ncbi:hypothetical protein SODALDRAFT_14992 [Sodiomyces alkalinus F11]|uniref:Uncharacterized protein n=1 Tax=Sodiomyces alkalinus (strain CBS 110278 / VKM F-3762 / F11) TaxID=1314773 RepID=A0A3N2Q6T6_SODAK|nr:hypothetical protein SODALDRAFT_14992 [Sodiomyces alkalinus F11]ROT42426.1 hypothetical protein SODALDRAFT_14992 [Sodiomyces alkalinus F11]
MDKRRQEARKRMKGIEHVLTLTVHKNPIGGFLVPSLNQSTPGIISRSIFFIHSRFIFAPCPPLIHVAHLLTGILQLSIAVVSANELPRGIVDIREVVSASKHDKKIIKKKESRKKRRKNRTSRGCRGWAHALKAYRISGVSTAEHQGNVGLLKIRTNRAAVIGNES